jgi:hypothetical protein
VSPDSYLALDWPTLPPHETLLIRCWRLVRLLRVLVAVRHRVQLCLIMVIQGVIRTQSRCCGPQSRPSAIAAVAWTSIRFLGDPLSAPTLSPSCCPNAGRGQDFFAGSTNNLTERHPQIAPNSVGEA